LIKTKRYKNIKYPKSKIYDFDYLNIDDLKKIYNSKLSWRIGKFIDYVFRVSIRYIQNDNYNEVYISDKDVKGILGEISHIELIEFLNNNDYIRCRRRGSNRFNYNKKLWFFKLNDGFFSCKKRYVEIEEGVLNKWIISNRKRKSKIYKDVTIKKDESGNVIDEFVRYELDCCKKTDVIIYDLDSVINERISSKLKYLQNESLWSWNNKSFEKDIEEWKLYYKELLKNRYQYLREDIFNFKNDDYENVVFKRDSFGERLYNLYSRVIRDYRRYIKIENEECVEIDIKSSHISILYYLINELSNDNCINEFILDIKIQLEKLGNKKLGKGFIKKHKLLFEGNGVFLSDDISIDEYNDFYGYMKSCFSGSSREEMKIFTQYILNSDTLRNRKEVFNYNGYGIDELEKLFFGNDGYDLINDLKKLDLSKYLRERKGKIKVHQKSNNISLILHKLENQLMDKCRKLMMNNGIIFISMFDSFIVKKDGSRKLMDILNKELEGITKNVKFRIDIKK
jgi:hypothetical protein